MTKRIVQLFIFSLTLLYAAGCNEDLLAYIQSHKEQIENGDYLPLLQSYLKSSTSSYNSSQTDLSLENKSLPGQSLGSIEILENSLSQDEQMCPTLFEGPIRGLSCLHCNQAQAQSQANIISTLLTRTCLKNIAINYLIDGSFGLDYSFMFSQVATLTAGGRNLHLVLYFANGPSQRQWNTTLVKSYTSIISPEEFRQEIRYNSPLRRKFISSLKESLPLLYFASYRGAKLYLVPMLEDNLDDESFSVMAGIMKNTLPNDLVYKLGRNPCSECYPNNGKNVPWGMFSESHSISPSVNIRKGIVTNDGFDYSMDPEQGPLTLQMLSLTRDRAGELGSIFILWSGARQGLELSGNTLVAPRKAPIDRNYAIPNHSERLAIVEFLREGITVTP